MEGLPLPAVHGRQKVSPVFQQCSDLLALQEEVCSLLHQKVTQQRNAVSRDDYEALYRELQDEKVEHAKTNCALVAEEEKLQFVNTELQVLRKQLEREKATFERAFGLLKSQALSDSSKAEHLLAKCTALEVLCTKKDEELASKEMEIGKLKQRLKGSEEAHRRELEELNIRMQQEVYMAKKLNQTEPKRPSRYK